MPDTVAISGSRGWNDRGAIVDCLVRMQESFNPVIYVGYNPETKTPKGVDEMVYDEATFIGLQVVCYPADWNGPDKKKAGHVRNKRMIVQADHMVAFWDGQSPGTANAIFHGLCEGILRRVYLIDGRVIEEESFEYLFANHKTEKVYLPPLDPLLMGREATEAYISAHGEHVPHPDLNLHDLNEWYFDVLCAGLIIPEIQRQYQT